MTQPRIKITGIEKPLRALITINRVAIRVKAQPGRFVTATSIANSLKTARKELTTYPPKPPHSRYIRTGRLRREWSAEADSRQVEIFNEAKNPGTGQFYAPYVIGKFQQPNHKRTGWTKSNETIERRIVDDIVEGLSEGIIAMLEREL